MRESANVGGIESTLNSIPIIRPFKPVRHWCLTEFIGNRLEVEVWSADMRAAKSPATTERQVRYKIDINNSSTLLFTNGCENMDMVMKNPKLDIRIFAAYFEIFPNLKSVKINSR
jgi:hypothetical protein